MKEVRNLILGLGVMAVTVATASGGDVQQKTRVSEATTADAARMRPLPPSGLTATIDDGRILLAWRAIPLDKIVGYEVYRRVGSKAFAKLVQVKEATFVDRDVPQGSVEYAISAVDVHANRSPLTKPVTPVLPPVR